MDPFERAMVFVFKWEGGFVDDPDDPGGVTKYGIAARYHPDVDVRNLTLQAAKDIYFREYWMHRRLQCREFRPPVAIALMDTAVNCGPPRAMRLLQRAASSRERPIAVDGKFGPQTLEAVNRTPGVVDRMIAERLAYYTDRCVRAPEKLKYARGWAARCVDLVRYVAQ